MKNVKEKNNALLLVLTPVIILLLCVGILIVALIKPYNKMSVYLNLAFMDEFKTNPGDETNGLVIVDGNIKTDYSGETQTEGELIIPSFGEQYAVLQSSGFELSVPVYWGSTSELLERGACQATYSKLAGAAGNTVISAHEDTFFADLDVLKEGDTVTLYTNYGEFVYTVSSLISFNKNDNRYVNPTNDECLTLYTCKKDILGSSDERIGVICKLTEKKFYVMTEEGTEN
ncbi:MAG: class D sortase [Ruminococcus sp.]|nr:class D sortase [Ruminococcus sp.]MBQ8297123.1 class D sortase [Ruminococcus sp.]